MNDPLRPVVDGAGPAERSAPWRGRVRAGVSALVLVAVTATAVVVARSTDAPAGEAPARGPATAGDTAVAREVAARAALQSVESAWRRRDRPALLAAAAATPAGRRWATATWRALDDLGVRGLALRLVVAGSPADGAARPSTATATAEASWTQPGWAAPATSTLTIDLDDAGRVVGTRGAPDAAAPLWALAPLRVSRSRSAVLVSLGVPLGAGSPADRGPASLVGAAATQVDVLLPPGLETGAGPLVVVLPSRQRQLGQVLGTDQEYRDIAAVTASVDGTVRTDPASQVVLNPSVLARLDPVGTRVVLAHEATHAATGAAAGRLPLWVVEGFADFVALHGGAVPVRVAAGRAIAQVRRDGLADGLPGAAAFRIGRHGLGRAYELSWLAFRTLEREHGTRAVLAFYRQVRAGRPVDVALRRSTGAGLDRLTADWRSALSRLARTDA